MTKSVSVISDGTENCIKAIGNSLIKKAKDISNDIDRVTNIRIEAVICNDEIINFDVTKNYVAELEDKDESI